MFKNWFGNKEKSEKVEAVEKTGEEVKPEGVAVPSEVSAEVTLSNSDQIGGEVVVASNTQDNQNATPTETPSNTEEVQQVPPLTFKEMKALKRARYEDKVMNNPLFKKAYLIKNKKTGQMAEIRAASSLHACNIIGWRPNKVVVLGEKDITEQQS